MHAAKPLPDIAVEILARIRAHSPRVHCITNAVAQNFTANVLLALGAVPTPTIALEEIASFVAGAHAILVNLGTLDPARREAIMLAAETAAKAQIPWIVDPVFVDRSPSRADFARALIAQHPAVIRLNTVAFSTMAGAAADARVLRRYAHESRSVVAVTGETDIVTDGERSAAIRNGHPLMARSPRRAALSPRSLPRALRLKTMHGMRPLRGCSSWALPVSLRRLRPAGQAVLRLAFWRHCTHLTMQRWCNARGWRDGHVLSTANTDARPSPFSPARRGRIAQGEPCGRRTILSLLSCSAHPGAVFLGGCAVRLKEVGLGMSERGRAREWSARSS